eukprot:TRINITY_DN19097_c0_g1_i2.p1 TRINITY_DN19097_c0_g1~~TRINITY_DN19097_c0_g1_i2.p1  ORF type:complete len:667 (+),score=100.62 TRINITY_DN19097_c0_g1_i2:38-2038(+)
MPSKKGLAPLKIRKQLDADGHRVMSNSKEIMKYYDTWPGNAGGGTKPELLLHIEKLIAKGLRQVSWKHKAADAPSKNPFGDTIYDAYRDSQPTEVSFPSTLSSGDALPYRQDRINIFLTAVCSFSSGFKTYRSILMWCMAELRSYESFITSILDETRAEVTAQSKSRSEEISDLNEKIKSLQSQIEAERRGYEDTLTENADMRKKLLEAKEEAVLSKMKQDGIAENARTIEATNQVLVNRMRKLEKRLAHSESNSMSNTLIPILEERLRESDKKASTIRRQAKACLEENEALLQKIKVLEHQGGSLEKHPEYVAMKEEATRAKNALFSSRAAQKTPRPDWEAYPTDIIEYDTNTRATTDKLVEQILHLRKSQEEDITKFSPFTKLRSSSTQRWISSLGCNDDIPIFLRCNHRIKNIFFSKRSAEFLIKEFWRERAFRSVGPLDEAFLAFMNRKYPPTAISETYSLIAALQQYNTDPDCFLFLMCLFGELNEGLIQRQLDVVKSFKEEVKELEDGSTPGFISKEVLTNHLNTPQYGPLVVDALDSDLKAQTGILHGDNIATDLLFANDHNQNETAVVESVRLRSLQDRDTYLGDIEDALLDLDSPELINEDIAESLHKVDPEMPMDRLANMLDDMFKKSSTIKTRDAIIYLRFWLLTRHQKCKHAIS